MTSYVEKCDAISSWKNVSLGKMTACSPSGVWKITNLLFTETPLENRQEVDGLTNRPPTDLPYPYRDSNPNIIGQIYSSTS